LAIFAMALRHADRLGADRVAHRSAQAAAAGKGLVRHGDPPLFVARMKLSEMREPTVGIPPDFASLHAGYELTPRRSLRSRAENLDWRAHVARTTCCRVDGPRNRSARYHGPSARRAGCKCRS